MRTIRVVRLLLTLPLRSCLAQPAFAAVSSGGTTRFTSQHRTRSGPALPDGRIRSVDDRSELSGLDQLSEVPNHRLVMLRNREHDLLAAMQRADERTERILGQRTQLRG